MWFEDLTPLHYHRGPLDADSWQAPLLAVGWLEHECDYSQGTSAENFCAKLQSMVTVAKTTHSHYHFRGLHSCTLCEAEGRGSVVLRDSYVNLFVPGIDVVYAAPAGIIHYIQFHSYLPPGDFVSSVERCAQYGSNEFLHSLRSANRGQAIPMRTWEEELQVQGLSHLAKKRQ